MVNAQEWLESQEQYNTKEKREKVRELNISGWDERTEEEKENWEKLTGSLDLNDFIVLEKLDCSFNELTELDCSNLVNLKELHCENNNLTDLNTHYCRQLQNVVCSRNNFTTLEINNKPYLQELDCSHNKKLTNLEVVDNYVRKINCSNCKITSLSVYNNSNLTVLNCSNNQLTSLLDFMGDAYAIDLTFLDASNNKLADNDDSGSSETFTKFTGLRELYLNNNPLSISLEVLQRCGGLRELGIENTQITKGLEYLPENLESFHCKGTKLAEELKNYFVEEEWNPSYYDYQGWRKEHWKEIAFAKFPLLRDELDNLEKENKEFESKLTQRINPHFIDYEDKLERKKKIFNLYIEKSNDEKAGEVEKEITQLEEEISRLKLGQQLQSHQEIPPKK